ncbi:hypothetical protein Daesc_008179 [Daldinia eschscholtzii]|uniref:Peptidase A1 domain-containing protein n=1 Tax=Daldinia eschscholtzii TaxID=292717 RepID=A0AAX6MBQ7_9PEZI
MAVPRAVRWSNKTLGPDGPWNAVEVTLGSGQDVTVYAGRMWESYFPGAAYCENTAAAGQPCYAQEAGAVYNESAGTGEAPPISFSADAYYAGDMDTVGSSAKRYTDRFSLGTDTSYWNSVSIDDFAMALMSDTQLRYPNGNNYPIFAGCLGLGAAPNIPGQAAGAINTSLLAGTLYTNHAIASQTFGLHIGSAAPNRVPGSLWLGGYDRNRAMNDMLALPIPDPYHEFSNAPLADISIDVVKGGSPFPWDSKGGLLASRNSSIGNQLGITIDACLPYLNLPRSTCDAIAAEIPVKLDEGLGLYLWDTESPDYPRIIQSPSVLTFTFVDPDSNLRKVNISVPFTHLNLTLTKPLVTHPTPYFPCNAASNGAYALGRAFLQDAFIGANLNTAMYFLSQAPGPNLNSENVMAMDNNGRTLNASNNDWITSWNGHWAPLPEPQKSTSNVPSFSGTVPERGIKRRQAIGAAVGGVIGFLLLLFIGLVIRKKYKKHGAGALICGLPLISDKKTAQGAAKDTSAEDSRASVGYSQDRPYELAPTAWQLPADITDMAAELETPHVVHELPAKHLGTHSQYYINR